MDPSVNPDREKEDAYHFVCYLPVNGVLYELDGLRKDPIMHAAVEEGGDWVDTARETIQARIATYPPGSVSPLSLINTVTQISPSSIVPRLLSARRDPSFESSDLWERRSMVLILTIAVHV